MGKTYIGTSGWSYEDWRRVFYPEHLKKGKMLDFYAQEFNLVEINSTFYALPNKFAVLAWNKKTPDDFVFTAKIPKEITHKRLLKNSESIFREFYSLMHPLIDAGKLGCFLIQLPPKFSVREKASLETFLEFLPNTIHFAVEFRHTSWDEWGDVDFLKDHGVAFAVTDSVKMQPRVEITSELGYVRWHGRNPQHWYNYEYSAQELQEWIPRIEEMKKTTKTLYLQFNNHPHGQAIRNARILKDLMGIPYTKASSGQKNLDGWISNQ
ncbi:MAG: DUF72 domain-containing protein [Theionarchaea archaeon]|nr:DUF72 domain-containing protein [Theionarchaea archaeon]